MAKIKTCSFCGATVSKLWYSSPPCCANYACKSRYNESKSKKGISSLGKKKESKNSVISKYSAWTQKPRKKIKPISDKKASELRIYRKQRDEYLADHTICEICNSKPSTDLHHKKPRAFFLLDISVYMALCRICHDRIEREDAWARKNGYKLNHL